MVQRILLIDDEPDIRQVGRLSLKGIGKWDVLLASSGQEGVEVARTQSPDLILLDVMMPGMDGPATLKALRTSEIQTPIIFLTAKSSEAQLTELRALGPIGIIPKPFDPMKLPDQVRQVLQQAGL